MPQSKLPVTIEIKSVPDRDRYRVGEVWLPAARASSGTPPPFPATWLMVPLEAASGGKVYFRRAVVLPACAAEMSGEFHCACRDPFEFSLEDTVLVQGKGKVIKKFNLSESIICRPHPVHLEELPGDVRFGEYFFHFSVDVSRRRWKPGRLAYRVLLRFIIERDSGMAYHDFVMTQD